MLVKLAQLRFFLPPLTPRGVAACAQTSYTRLFTVQCVVAILSGMVVLWVAQVAWFPILRQAIAVLPARGEISRGTLRWEGTSPTTLAAGHFLAVAVSVDDSPGPGNPAHLRIEFGATHAQVCSLLGCVSVGYPQHWRIAFNRPELDPWWGARESFIRFGVAGLVAAGVWLIWQILSFLYCLPVWLAATMSKRELSLAGALRMAGAALIPGAAVMLITIGLYGFGMLDVVRLLFGVGLHLVIGWAYLIGSVFFIPRVAVSTSAQNNPFEPEVRKSGGNPFDSSGADAR